jgi:hypothetical protein
MGWYKIALKIRKWRNGVEMLTAKSKVVLIKLWYEATVTTTVTVMTQTDKVAEKEENNMGERHHKGSHQ